MSPLGACEELGTPKGFLSACLLLLLAEGSGHGYELADRLRSFSFDMDDPSHVYRLLRSLDAEGLAESTWTTLPGSGPARRIYRLTPQGWEDLERCAASLGDLSKRVDSYLERVGRARATRRGGTDR